MLISIIIPAYNSEKYLDECLSSCFRQDINTDHYEVIVINDGSTDNTLEIVQKWASDYNNIKIISQHNKGLSEARNAGIAAAEGEYIMFLDSDDWIKDHCLREIISKCRENGLDMYRICAANVIDGKAMRRFTYSETAVSKGSTLLKGKYQVCAPFAIYKRDFLLRHSLKFYPGIFHEDNLFTPIAYYMADKIGTSNDIIYFVRQTQGSITRSVNPKKCHDLLTVAKKLETFAEGAENKYRSCIYMQAANCVNWCLNGMLKLPANEVEVLKKILREKKYLTEYFFKSRSVLHRIEGIFFRIFPNRMLEIYRILDLIHYQERKKKMTK